MLLVKQMIKRCALAINKYKHQKEINRRRARVYQLVYTTLEPMDRMNPDNKLTEQYTQRLLDHVTNTDFLSQPTDVHLVTSAACRLMETIFAEDTAIYEKQLVYTTVIYRLLGMPYDVLRERRKTRQDDTEAKKLFEEMSEKREAFNARLDDAHKNRTPEEIESEDKFTEFANKAMKEEIEKRNRNKTPEEIKETEEAAKKLIDIWRG